MPSEQEELKARLMKEAEEVIEALLAGKRAAGENSLSDIERLALRGGRSFEERVTQALAEEESGKEGQPVCEECGVGMRSLGRRRRSIVTESGEARIERRYYVCPRCGKKAFPPG
jgi:uncharacterized protein with PIN domain